MNGLSVDRSYLVLKDLVIGGFIWFFYHSLKVTRVASRL